MVTSAQRMESTECWKYIQAKAQSGTKRVSRESPYCVKQNPNHPLVTFVERMLRAESGMFDIQPVLSAIPGPISTLVTLYFALNPPLCRLWEPAGALYTSNAHRSSAQICPFFLDRIQFWNKQNATRMMSEDVIIKPMTNNSDGYWWWYYWWWYYWWWWLIMIQPIRCD